MCLTNSRYALVLALKKKHPFLSFSTGTTNLEALLIQLSGRGTVKYLETRVIPVYGISVSVYWAGAVPDLKVTIFGDIIVEVLIFLLL